MRRRRNPDLGTKDILIIGAVAGGVYLLYQLFSKVGGAVASGAAAVYHGAQIVAAPVSNAIASAWNSLTLSAPLSVPGNIVFPDGTTAPLAGQTIKSDTDGNVYVYVGGVMYQLGQSDANGNWPATMVLDPNFGATSGGW